jgi:hypothetical protein
VALLVAVIGGPVGASIDGSHIAYTANISYAGILIALYIVATCGSCLVASNRWLALLRLANLSAVIALGWITFTGFTSLWCAWAALTSVAIAIYLRDPVEPAHQPAWRTPDQADEAVTWARPSQDNRPCCAGRESSTLCAAMASVLRRFRRLSPPGAAMAGVAPPTDPEVARISELAPVFVALDAMQQDVDAIVEAGRVEADRIRSQAAADAEAVVARAMERSVAVKTRESQRRLERSAIERDARIAAGEAQAATVRANADARAVAVADAVVHDLAALAAAGGVDR